MPLAADLQEAAPGALGLPEGSLRELIVLWPVVARFSDVRRYLAPREGGSAAASSVRPSLSVADRRVVALRDLQACEQILREGTVEDGADDVDKLHHAVSALATVGIAGGTL